MASNGEKFLYFLVGGFVGAAVGLLLAPKTGQETRELIESKYREGADRIRQRAREGRDAIGSRYQEGRQTVKDKYSEISGKVSGSFDRGRNALDRQKDQLSAALEAGRQAYEEQKRKLEEPGTPVEEESGS